MIMKTLKLNDTERKEIEKKESEYRKDPIEISHKNIQKVINIINNFIFREKK